MLLSSVQSAHTTSFLSFTSTLLSSAASSSICRSALSFFSLNSLAYNKCKTKVNNEHCLNFQVIILQSKTRKRGCHGCLPFTWPVPLWENGEQNSGLGSCLTFVQFSFFYQKRLQRLIKNCDFTMEQEFTFATSHPLFPKIFRWKDQNRRVSFTHFPVGFPETFLSITPW